MYNIYEDNGTCPNGCGALEIATGHVESKDCTRYWDVSIAYCPQCNYSGDADAS